MGEYTLIGPFSKEFILKNYDEIRKELKRIKPLEDWMKTIWDISGQ